MRHRLTLAGRAADVVGADAYRAFLKGRYYRRLGGESGLEKAAEELERSIDLAPHFAPAEALRLDPDLAEAHAADAIVKFCLAWDFDAAERAFSTYLELNDQDPIVLEWYIRFLTVTGRYDEALDRLASVRGFYTESPVIELLYGTIYEALGKESQSVAAYLAALSKAGVSPEDVNGLLCALSSWRGTGRATRSSF